MLSKEDLKVVINGMLRCVGYELKDNCLSTIVAQNGINGWIVSAIPPFLPEFETNPNTVFYFMDEHSSANLYSIAWYEGNVLNFVVKQTFVKANAPWYHNLPILQIVYDTSNNTAWFLYRYHAIVGKIEENKQFKANRIPIIMNNSAKETLTISDMIEELSDCFDPKLTVDTLEHEIHTDQGETCGLPDLIKFFKERNMI